MHFHIIFIIALGLSLAGCLDDRSASGRIESMTRESRPDPKPVTPSCGPAGCGPQTAGAWKERLTPEQYKITRMQGTEAPFTGRYWNEKTPGVYRCVCCGTELFRSDSKFDSGCGWPSFTAPAKDASVKMRKDLSGGMVRTEVLCQRCDAHLGHVFEDGPAPTGMRYCINSAALELVPTEGSGDRKTK